MALLITENDLKTHNVKKKKVLFVKIKTNGQSLHFSWQILTDVPTPNPG